jgi:hypothetical protein
VRQAIRASFNLPILMETTKEFSSLTCSSCGHEISLRRSAYLFARIKHADTFCSFLWVLIKLFPKIRSN